VTYAIATLDVRASVSRGHGSVDPASQAVGYGGEAVIDLIPDSGYHILSITDNGVPQTVADPYVITDVTGDHTVVVTFESDVTVTSITPDSAYTGSLVGITELTGSNFEAGAEARLARQASAVAAGRRHTVALRPDGTVAAEGDNNYDQCEVYEWTDITAVAAGANHTVGLRSDGTVVAVGDNNYDQCYVEDWTDITAIAVPSERRPTVWFAPAATAVMSVHS
jgi:hypothetical protein